MVSLLDIFSIEEHSKKVEFISNINVKSFASL
jgi:hypothetical protein